MDITCGRCRRSYFVPDDLAQGRIFRAKCSQCGHAFSVEVPERARKKRPPQDDLVPTAASAIPGLADDLADQLGWLEEKAKEVAEDEVVLLTVRRSRRGSAAAMVAGAVLVLAAGGGVAAWLALRPKPDAPARRAQVARGDGAAVVHDVGGLAFREPPPPEEPAAPAPATAAPVQRAKTARLARDDRRLLDLLAKKDDVAVVPLEEEEGGSGNAQSALDPEAAAKVIGANRKALDACISRALRLNPSQKLARRATLVVTIQPSGTVSRAYLAEEEVDRSDLGACLVDTARRMVFPAFDGEPVDVATPLSLSAVF